MSDDLIDPMILTVAEAYYGLLEVLLDLDVQADLAYTVPTSFGQMRRHVQPALIRAAVTLEFTACHAVVRDRLQSAVGHWAAAVWLLWVDQTRLLAGAVRSNLGQCVAEVSVVRVLVPRRQR